jgi:CTP:phosphocholine cytidylyltransferase-like protein/thiamine kinase-like enzyme
MGLFKVDNAVILAAGFGSRFVPITYELPKGLIPVKGEPLLERQIRQLKGEGIDEIVIVVGYLKEKFDYLVDKFGVKLVFNPEYAIKNNLASLYCARNFLKNSYILYADNWIEKNIFNPTEDKSWYSCVYKTGPTSEWCVKTDENGRITDVTIGGYDSWVMYGPVFFSETFSEKFVNKIEEYYNMPGKENYMWENVFIDELRHFDLHINKQNGDNVYEFESLEELRQFDPDYSSRTPNTMLQTIGNIFDVDETEIVDIKNLKAGMTNRSFGFSIKGKSYIFRLPGEGTGELINRKQERDVYKAIKKMNISDEVIHFDKKTGIKISIFYENARNTSAQNHDDVETSMAILRRFHQQKIRVSHSFDIAKEISRYLLLCNERDAIRFTDNEETYKKMKELVICAKKTKIKKVLCHIDSNPDNFVKLADGSVKLIDWEYAGMCDPIMDISMYAIYSYYSQSEMDTLLRVYLQREPNADE